MLAVRMLWIVAMKLIAPAIEAIVRRGSDRIHRSTPWPGEDRHSQDGPQQVQPQRAAPPAERKLVNSVRPPKRKNQYDIAFRRGNATSRAPIISGTRKFPKPARIGTTTRKTITVPWSVNSSL